MKETVNEFDDQELNALADAGDKLNRAAGTLLSAREIAARCPEKLHVLHSEVKEPASEVTEPAVELAREEPKEEPYLSPDWEKDWLLNLGKILFVIVAGIGLFFVSIFVIFVAILGIGMVSNAAYNVVSAPLNPKSKS